MGLCAHLSPALRGLILPAGSARLLLTTTPTRSCILNLCHASRQSHSLSLCHVDQWNSSRRLLPWNSVISSSSSHYFSQRTHRSHNPSILRDTASPLSPPQYRSPTAHSTGLYGASSVTCTLHKQSERRQVEEEPFVLSPQGIVKASPPSWQPYMRLMRIDRPIGTWLLFLPCAWSIGLATQAGHLPDPTLLALFALGSFFMRGAGCTINDMWDRDFDAKVARTKGRPIACGQVNMFNALTFLGAQLSISLAILLSFNWTTVALGACSIIPCVIYPLMKRVTFWPQIFLGLTFNWGGVMGWSALTGAVDWGLVLPLYVGSIAWTLMYDTIYAHQDKEDDIMVGVKSTALRLGDNTKPWLCGFGATMVGALGSVGYMCDQTWPYFLGVSYIAGHMAHQIYSVDLNDPDDCGKKFRSNRNLGIVFWAAIMAGTYLKAGTDTETKDKIKQKESRLV